MVQDKKGEWVYRDTQKTKKKGDKEADEEDEDDEADDLEMMPPPTNQGRQCNPAPQI